MKAGSRLLAAVVLAAAVRAASAQCPEWINYQGRLLDGTNLVNGAVSLLLSLYDSPTGGSLQYQCSNDVTAVDGLYTAYLGSNTLSGSLTNALASGPVYLDIKANNQQLTPRERLLSVPYALYSGVASQAVWSARAGGATLARYADTADVARVAFTALVALAVQQLPDFDNVVWVGLNGSPTNPGTFDKPLYPPQKGYDVAATKYANDWATLVIAGGAYTNGLVMHAGNVHVFGLARPVLNGLTNTAVALTNYPGKQRVEGIVFTNDVTVRGSGVKFNNCRVEDARTQVGDGMGKGADAEFLNCRLYCADRAALWVMSGVVTVGVQHCAIESKTMQMFPLPMPNPPGMGGTVDIANGVTNLVVARNEVINTFPVENQRAPAIIDREAADYSGMPIAPHLYIYNYIKGPITREFGQGGGGFMNSFTVWDPGSATQTIVFIENAVWGDVGANANKQFYINNSVYGIIVAGRAAGLGWQQAGQTGAMVMDQSGNIEHDQRLPRLLPDAWKD